MENFGRDLRFEAVVPDSYRGAFLDAGRLELFPPPLAPRLADAAGLRNILVHLYEKVDYEIVASSIDRALSDFPEFLDVYSARLAEPGP